MRSIFTMSGLVELIIVIVYGCSLQQTDDVNAANTNDSIGLVPYKYGNALYKNTPKCINKRYLSSAVRSFRHMTQFQRKILNSTATHDLAYAIINSFNSKENDKDEIGSDGRRNGVGFHKDCLHFPIAWLSTYYMVKKLKFLISISNPVNIRSSGGVTLSRDTRSSDGVSLSRNVKYADFMNCKDDEFHCIYSGTCIPKLSVCDRNNDCVMPNAAETAADESNCLQSECPPGAFQCTSGECLSYIHRCDGTKMCWDGSDEEDCSPWSSSTCPPHFYRCRGGQCVQSKRRCDSNNVQIAENIRDGIDENPREKYWSADISGILLYFDCFNGSDEWACEKYACPPDYFKCKNGQCVLLSARCDNNTADRFYFIQDCRDGSDEEDCEDSECGEYFRCADGYCLHPSGRCDGVPQCNDGSDEFSCNDTAHWKCPPHSFSCGPGHCVPYVYRCTGSLMSIHNLVRNHCPGTSSISALEDYCPLSKCPVGYFRCRTGQCMRHDICNRQDNVNFCDQRNDPTDHCGRSDCPRDYFRCENGHCLHHVSVCDNVPECPNGEDETHCGRAQCREDQVDCGDGNCIPVSLRCDRYNHCASGQDEVDCGASVGTQPSTSECYSSNEFVDIQCSFGCSAGCICTNGLVDCSSSTFIYMDSFNTTNIWPFDNISVIDRFPIKYDEIFLLSRVYGMNLSHSMLTTVPTGTLRFTPYVQILDLSHNLLTVLRPGSFNGLYRFSMIDLSFNQIQTIDDFTFKGLRVLRLNLENNLVKQFGLDLFGGMAADGTIRADDFKVCCVKPAHLPVHNCFPSADMFSFFSCEDLIRQVHFRVLLWIIGGFAFIGNLGVAIRRFVDTRGKKRTSYGLFIVNLHISDNLMGIYLMIIAIADVNFRGNYVLEDQTWRESFTCTLAGVLSVISNVSLPMFALLITIDRYLGVKYPFGEKRISVRLAIALTTCAWISSVCLAVAPIIFTSFFKGEFYSSSVVCLAIPFSTRLLTGWQYSAVVYGLINSLLFICILIGQVAIMQEIWVAKTQTKTSSAIDEIKIAKSLMCIVLTDFLCWFPVCILVGLSLAGVYMTLDVYSWVVILILPFNAALNPIMYTLMIGRS